MLMKYHCFLDVGDIAECAMLMLPSPEAIAHEEIPYYDDYYLQIKVCATEGTLYRSLRCDG